MGHFYIIKVLVYLQFLCLHVTTASIIAINEFQVKAVNEPLDPGGKYLLSWDVDLTNGKITFEAEVATKGYVGFGISKNGNMNGADIFLAGVSPDGKSYSHDMHSSGPGRPTEDDHSDWELLEAREDSEKTYLKFSRLLRTCDDQDYPISNDTVRLIWSMGASDRIEYHITRGTTSVNLLMPSSDDFDDTEYLKWDLESNTTMPADDTTYWCTIHKAPNLNHKHHIIAFEPILPDELAINHTHHFIIHKCIPPEGSSADEVFEKFVDHPGSNCYLSGAQQPLPINLCLGRYLQAWAKGGKRMVFPDDLGHPFPDNLGESSYYLLEIHYDNPEELGGLTFNTGARVLYTDNLRPIDAGLLTVAYDVGMFMTIPPNQTEFVVAGNCGSKCTESALDDNGIKVFNSGLHSHLSGRKLKVRHFRGNKELPWLDYDDHYDFNFQQNKPLREYVQILKGDHLTVECTYDTAWNGHKVVVGGLSTREEMCMAFLWYYPQNDFEYCGSRYPPSQHFAELGITVQPSRPPNGGLQEYIITAPPELAGDYVESLSTKFNWTQTESFIKKYEHTRRYQIQDGSCVAGTRRSVQVQFPDDFDKYTPEDLCKPEAEPGPGPGGEAGNDKTGGVSSVVPMSLCTVISTLCVWYTTW